MIHLSEPQFLGHEVAYVNDALSKRQLSGGEYVARFEAAWAARCAVPHALACSSGTAALHLLMAALGVRAGDEVIVPATTYIATANAVTYCGGVPVWADVDPCTWTLQPSAAAAAVTQRTVGIIAVHLYGVPADMSTLRFVAQQHDLWLVEDAAEAHGARYGGQSVGSLGDAAAFSFHGSKMITCGEGGMVTTADGGLAERVRSLRGQGADPKRRYWHTEVGYNYRLGELAAAVGLAQVEHLDQHLAARRRVDGWYRSLLGRRVVFQAAPGGSMPAHWLTAILLPTDVAAQAAADRWARAGYETRPVFPPLSEQPPYHQEGPTPMVAADLARRGLCLPTHAGVTRHDVAVIAQIVAEVLP
jgi:perosamine synthetase